MIICVDFDGTCVTHEYPKVGRPLPQCIETLQELNDMGHQLILYTMRNGQGLKDAVDYLESYGVVLWGANENPEQHEWTDSIKVFAHMYIDDMALGIPLERLRPGDRMSVNWVKVRELLELEPL